MTTSSDVVDQVISVFRAAAAANRSTPARHGNVVVLSPQVADDVMVTADLHGNRLNFNRILELADLDRHPRRHLIMQEVCHGGPTYPAGGGCMSHLMLEDVARLKQTYPERFHFLLSNHELAELTDYPIVKSRKMLNLMFRTGMQEMYGEATDRVREAFGEFLSSCPLAVRMTNGVFICHSLPTATDQKGFDVSVLDRPLTTEDFDSHGEVFRLVWGRDYRSENAEAFSQLVGAQLLLTGHEPCPEGYQLPNARQIILDCCGETASVVTLPVGEPLSQEEVVRRIRPLASSA